LKVKFNVKEPSLSESPGMYNDDGVISFFAKGLDRKQLNRLKLAIQEALKDEQ
jgi:hypothetical protein